jgi:predicted XRE-type DNA-binding protein
LQVDSRNRKGRRFLLINAEPQLSRRTEQKANSSQVSGRQVVLEPIDESGIDLPDAGELDTEVRLAVAIDRLLAARRLVQAQAAAARSINQPKVSAPKHYKLEGYSVERLMGFLTALGSDIEIRIRRPKRSPGRIRVEAV